MRLSLEDGEDSANVSIKHPHFEFGCLGKKVLSPSQQ